MLITEPALSQLFVNRFASGSMPRVAGFKKKGNTFLKKPTTDATNSTSGLTRTSDARNLWSLDRSLVKTKGIKPTTFWIAFGCFAIARIAISAPMLCPTTAILLPPRPLTISAVTCSTCSAKLNQRVTPKSLAVWPTYPMTLTFERPSRWHQIVFANRS